MGLLVSNIVIARQVLLYFAPNSQTVPFVLSRIIFHQIIKLFHRLCALAQLATIRLGKREFGLNNRELSS